MKVLEDYLNNLLKIAIYKHHSETISFLELSYLSFINDLGDKGKEGLIMKRTGSSSKHGCNFCGLIEGMCCIRCSYFCTSFCGSWHTRHLVVKDTFIAYINPKNGQIKSVILMDNGFEVSSGIYSTGLRNGLQITNSSRHIVIKCWTRRKAKEWLEFIQNIAITRGKYFIQSNPHGSFAPYRSSTSASWFVDGANYMSAVADVLEAAKEEIFIADWWLSPEIYMKRPIINGDYWRLDKILLRKAQEGVKVFIMIYKEVELALGINSFYSKQKLVEKCPENIKVLRHPDHARVGIFLWAHHEKIVVIDQSIAFIGGIDLCYGRWDTNEHRLTDLGSVHQSSIYIPTRGKVTTSSSKKGGKKLVDKNVFLPLAIATNTIAMATTKCIPVLPLPKIKSTINSTPVKKIILQQQQQDEQFEQYEQPQQSFQHQQQQQQQQQNQQQVSIQQSTSCGYDNPRFLSPSSSSQEIEHLKCNTPDPQKKNIFDMARTTVDKVKQNVKIKRQEFINMVYSNNEISSSDDEDEIDNAGYNNRNNFNITEPIDVEEVLKNNADILSGLPGAAKLWLGKDYTNFVVKDFYKLEQPYQDLVDRSTTPRMPWHDMGIVVQGSSARDIARHFIQRWNAIKVEKAKLHMSYPFLLPKCYNNNFTNFMDKIFLNEKFYNVKCQILRSISSWSAGLLESDVIEESIHQAYIDAITNSEKYIYIENQFFITLATMERHPVKNRIGETLLKRILRAHREGSVFRVFIIMPLLPGFEGEIGGPTGTTLHAITHWNYASISRGKDAIINRLIESGIKNPSDYITFHGLRTHDMLNGTLVTELIYVHSKLMIIDDKTIICGSANINDRSMIATRDSEIGIIIHDLEFDDGKMNLNNYPSGKFAGSLRRQLFREHLGLIWSKEKIDIQDPIKKTFYEDIWRKRSQKNTQIFEDIFQCIPSDKVKSFAELKIYQKKPGLGITDPDAAKEMLTGLRGQIVDMPLEFLKDETLTPAVSTVEGILPTSLWT
ncbi:phospholipase D1 isoform X2 [Aphidius gifuensis]|nr:phospholipase D1 isoform X2 [Aphidius gifuensis]